MVLHQRWIYAKSEPMALTVYKRHGTALGVIPESGGGFHGDNISPPAHSAPAALLLHFAMTTPITPSSSPTNLQENGEEETNNMVATPPVETSTSEVRVSPPRPSVLVPPQNDAISRKMQNGHCPTAPPPLPTPSVLSEEEAALLAKLEAANKLIETDVKSLNSLSGITNSSNGHSRKSSDTSQISFNSGSSSTSQDRSEDHEEDQWSLWGRIVTEWETYFKKRNQYVKELVRKGIPHHFRGVVWPLLCGANDSPAKHQYADYIKATSACEKVIRRDIARTYPEHDFFKEKDGLGQESLFNVMKAYSLHDREVGYCQGSAFIVGLLLMQMPEEEAFAVLVKLMQEYRLREMFKPTMAELGLCMYQLKCLVEELLPDLHVHFTSQSFDTSMYASSWFLTLFTTNLTLPVACRVMDTFLSDGMEVIFRVAIAILAAAKDDLLSLDMEGMLKYFQKETPARFDSCPDVLMTAAYNVKYSVKRIRKLEKDYIALKTKEQEDQEEVRRLRTENRMLRQKASMLETESSELAERLVRGQVSKADYEETAFQLQRELEALRQHNAEKTAQLREAQERLKHMEENSSRQSSLENGNSPSLQAELLKQKEELIQCLQEQLIGGRLRQAEMEAMIRDMRTQLQELEEEKKRLRECTPDNTVATLQEELIAVKLREAEATLALKDLRPKIAELSAQWIRHLQEQHADNVQSSEGSSNTPKKLLFWENNRAASKVEEELMTTRLREMEAITELRELRLRVMELETQNQVIGNQLKRQDEENKALKEKLELSEKQEKEYLARIKEQERKYADLGAKMREDSMLARIRNAENSQLMAELAQKISTLELKNQQLLAEGELSNVEDSERVRELQERVADFKAEVKRLEHVNKKLSLKISPSTGSNGLRQEQQQQANRPGSLMCSNRNSKSASPPASPVSEEEDFSQLHLRLSPRNSVTSLNGNL